jgi:hypothetical protein
MQYSKLKKQGSCPLINHEGISGIISILALILNLTLDGGEW